MKFIKNLPFEHLEINEDKLRFHFLENAVNESINLIYCGLDYFCKVDFTNNDLYYSLSFFNLSRGFELLMKCMICYKRYDKTKDDKNYKKHFPTKEELKVYGHNLNRLRKEIIKNYQGLFRVNVSNEKMISQLKDDHDFISEDKKLIRILKIISKYGTEGRYYELDYVTSDDKKNNISLKHEMERLILEFLEKDEQLLNTFINAKEGEELLVTNVVWQEIIKQYIKPYLNKFIEVLSRQFSYGILGNKAKMRIN